MFCFRFFIICMRGMRNVAIQGRTIREGRMIFLSNYGIPNFKTPAKQVVIYRFQKKIK